MYGDLIALSSTLVGAVKENKQREREKEKEKRKKRKKEKEEREKKKKAGEMLAFNSPTFFQILGFDDRRSD